jgi:hypothetical protein
MMLFQSHIGRRRKRRSPQSPLYSLPEGIQAALLALCRTVKPYPEILTWLRETHGLKVSQSALSRWFSIRSAPPREIFMQKGEILRVEIGGCVVAISAPGAHNISVQIERQK